MSDPQTLAEYAEKAALRMEPQERALVDAVVAAFTGKPRADGHHCSECAIAATTAANPGITVGEMLDAERAGR